ncbi:hypothetical protein GGD87_000808 [Rhodobaca bogoriensis DSM 18756]|nr:hypothetical protein [Rhodobaca bogoriensis DSM 18756]
MAWSDCGLAAFGLDSALVKDRNAPDPVIMYVVSGGES